MLPLAFDYEYHSLQTIHSCDHNYGDQGELSAVSGDTVDEVAQIDASCGKDDSAEEIDEDDETHAKAAEPTQVIEEDKLRQVVDCRVDPTTALGEEDRPSFRGGCVGVSVRNELVRHSREMFGH